MIFEISRREFWLNTLQQIYVDTGLKLSNKKVNDTALIRFRDSLSGSPTFALPSSIYSFERSWNWGNHINFNIGNTYLPQADLRGVKTEQEEQEEQERKEALTKYFWAALCVLPIAGAYFGYCLKEISRAKKGFETYHQIQTAQDDWAYHNSDNISLDLKKIIQELCFIDRVILEEKQQKLWISLEILVSGAVLLIGSMIASKIVADIAFIGLILGVVGLLAHVVYHWDDEADLQRNYQSVHHQTTAALNGLAENPSLNYLGPTRAVAVTPPSHSMPEPTAPPAYEWAQTRQIFI
jgi:hypothetical protein